MTGLIERLPPLRGRLKAGAPLAQVTWFRVGGPAELLFKPADEDDLSLFMKARPREIPLTVIGVGSNLLVRDGGVPGFVVKLGPAFAAIGVEDGQRIRVGAATLDQTLAEAARAHEIAGLEFLSGIPGTIGGALCMNAGAFGAEMKDAVVEVRAMDPDGRVHLLAPAEMGFSYRHTGLPEGWLFLEALLQGRPGEKDAIAARMAEIRTAREASQPIRGRTGGSTFANPPGHSAWKLIDEAGCRGLTLGGAAVSEKHCNFLLNAEEASAADIEALGEEIRRRVKASSGIDLEWEIRRIGIVAGGK